MHTFDSTLSSSSTDPLPPRIYVIGSLDQNPKALLKVANFDYAIDDPIKAFDVLFRIYVAMSLQFPPQAYPVWIFIERFVYKLKTNNINNSQLSTIINEMEIFSKNK